MYTATLKNRLIEGGKIRWVVEFNDGSDIFTESFNVNKYSDLQPRVAIRLSELNYIDTFTIDGLVDSTVPEPTLPTQEEKDKALWFRNFDRLEKLNKLNNLGALRANLVTDLDTLKATVAADFKRAYIADM